MLNRANDAYMRSGGVLRLIKQGGYMQQLSKLNQLKLNLCHSYLQGELTKDEFLDRIKQLSKKYNANANDITPVQKGQNA